jgi:predicted nucleic acid-binding Zn ribbon protein
MMTFIHRSPKEGHYLALEQLVSELEDKSGQTAAVPSVAGRETILTVSEYGTFSRAGKILNRTQPAAMRSCVQAVEEALETVLLDRTTRRRFSLKRVPAAPFPLPNMQGILFNLR